ncbi:VgrG-related protein [Pseudodesulfovibrio portus]|uniref:Type VI secretion system spike protein VgrG3-like C-terminal domain-containing protein n=1 Tax=Pseudodesulfovibrio portus TaxID=231439 RepID=A0ABN6RS83_9BACT|nr:hypothetical protein [Pseudodesulfovibrio portus]BDQ32945.1 hypothetical protein JCM14722_04870 [Pseudodesulfovibrio portus]
MSIGKIGDYDVMASLVQGNGMKGGQRSAQLRAAFDDQMSMTQQLFGEGSTEYGEGSSDSFDVSMINDSMMMEALATITRLMRDEAKLPRGQGALAPGASPAGPVPAPAASDFHVPGALSARFESGDSGVSAIGYDRVGGTSYGKYQIASRPGTMDRFLNYLDEKAPEWADRLRRAGPANTGSKTGDMPAQWKAIAAEDPARFERLQHDFIAGETYRPARDMILGQTGLDFNNAPPALREVLWSTSVQHGATGAAKIFNKVIERFVSGNRDEDFNAMLIKGVYDTRKGQFESSTGRVQKAVANRMDTEKQLALSMLGQTKLNRIV